MDERTYRRLFSETPRQTRIRHNWPHANHLMTRSEREEHQRTLREYDERRKKEKDDG